MKSKTYATLATLFVLLCGCERNESTITENTKSPSTQISPSGASVYDAVKGVTKVSDSGVIDAQLTGKTAFLYEEDNGGLYSTSFTGIGAKQTQYSSFSILDEDDYETQWFPVIISGDGKEPFAGVLKIDCFGSKNEWVLTSYRTEIPSEVVAAARREFCPKR